MSIRAVHSEKFSVEATKRFGYSDFPDWLLERSPGVLAGSTLWISGQVALSGQEIVGKGDIVAQTVQVFENLKDLLHAAGADLDSLVSTTTYMTDVSYSLAINDVRKQYLVGPVLPTNTLLIVAGLARPDFLVEISGVAMVNASH